MLATNNVTEIPIQQQFTCVYDGPDKLQQCCFNPSKDYCGGDPPQGSPYWADLEQWHMGCTSFPARPSNLNQVLERGWCKDPSFGVFVRSSAGSAMWKAEGHGVDDWWVFHGCDGAGLMSDCMGGVQYLEHYIDAHKPVAYDPEKDHYTLTWQLDPASRNPQNSNFNNMDGTSGCDGTDTSHQGVQNCWKRHLRSLHTHPGTGRADNLDSGMWDPSTWKEQGKPWWRYMIPAGADVDNPGSTQLQNADYYINKFLMSGGPVRKAATGEWDVVNEGQSVVEGALL